ncbi:S-adenosyl-L-methionine-dependent methyltransferase [Chytriomyces sp. MP71]|nr:S-adenosyl-L-methionine-dependent methyltransferase [Chytriomyces sp. MP71]
MADPTVSIVDELVIDEEKAAEIDRIFKNHASKPISAFIKNKLINEAPKNWDLFYKRNTTNFFKDRHWTWREFPELVESASWDQGARLLEVGCGVGNFVWPLLEQNKAMFIYACDFSPRAVNFVKENELYAEERMKAFVCDLTANPLMENVPVATLDFVTAIFCLSAIPPSKLEAAVRNIATVLKPGGVVLFRDYGIYDEAELRFKPGHMMEDHFYMRQDGTFSVYFSLEQIAKLFGDAGFSVEANQYVTKEVENRKRELTMERIWVQSKFRKL